MKYTMPIELAEAWVKRVRNVRKARVFLTNSYRLFDTGNAVRAERYKAIHARLERAADAEFLRVLNATWNKRYAIERLDGGLSWVITTWPPYQKELGIKHFFGKSMTLPVKKPRSFEALLKRGVRK